MLTALTSAAVAATVLVTPVGAAVADTGRPTTPPRLVRVELSPEGSGAEPGTLPVTVTVQYRLDGKLVAPHDLVGRSGHLKVTYDVRNASAHSTLVTYRAAGGRAVTKSVSVVTPYVARLTTTLPRSTRHLVAPRAQVPGLGRGDRVAWSMVLFAPVGSSEQSFGWSADVHHATLPVVDVQLLPLMQPVIPGLAREDHQQARASAFEVAAGHGLSSRLIRLRDGTQKILEGLTKLSAAAVRLQQGLKTQADPRASHLTRHLNHAVVPTIHVLAGELGATLKPGTGLPQGVRDLSARAARLARGLHAAHLSAEDLTAQADGVASTATHAGTGAQQLTDSAQGLSDDADLVATTAGQVSTNGRQVASDASSAYTGSQTLAADLTAVSTGLAQISSGLDQLIDAGTGLPAAAGSVKSLKDTIGQAQVGVDQALATIGDSGTTASVLGELTTAAGTLDQLSDANSGLPAAKSGVDQAQQDLATAAAAGGEIDQLEQDIEGTQTLLALYIETATCSGPSCDDLNSVVSNLSGLSLDPLRTQIQGDADDLAAASTGLASALGEVATLQTALDNVTVGVNQVKQSLSSGDPANPGVKEGLAEASTGIQQLVTQLDAAVTQVTGLGSTAHANATNAQQLGSGAADLLTGLDTLTGGASSLASGANDLASGANELRGGATSLTDGATRVAGDSRKAADAAKGLASKAGSLSSELGRSGTRSHDLSTGIDTAGARAAALAKRIDAAARGSRRLTAHVHLAAIRSGHVRHRTHTIVRKGRRLLHGRHVHRRGVLRLASGTPTSGADLETHYATLLALCKRGAHSNRSVAYEYRLMAATDAGPGSTGWSGMGLLAGGALLVVLAGRRFRRVRSHD